MQQVIPPHLHAHKLGDLAIRRLDGCHCQQVPEGRAILAVIEQPAADRLAGPDSIAQLGHLLRICALALQEAAAAAAAEGGDEGWMSCCNMLCVLYWVQDSRQQQLASAHTSMCKHCDTEAASAFANF